MPMGLQVFDAAGNLKLHVGHRVYKVLTIANIGTGNTGQYTNTAISGSNNVVPVLISNGGSSYKNPTVTVDKPNNRVAWDYTGVTAGERYSNLKMMVVLY